MRDFFKNIKEWNINKKIVVSIIVLLVIILLTLMIIYEFQGEENMPFELAKVYVISTAEGAGDENSENKQNMTLMQNNDIYFQIEKNEKFKKLKKIDKVIIENIQIKEPNIRTNKAIYAK